MELRLKLFDDVTGTPIKASQTSINWDEEELTQIITPYSKCTGQKSADFSIQIPSHKKTGSRLNKLKKNLFRLTPKRQADEIDDISPSPKRARLGTEQNTECAIIDAVNKLVTETDLIADGSRDYHLPTIPGKHSDLKSISPETLSRVLKGDYQDILDHVTIVDCRYPYEYEGGHIKGAVNLYTKDDVYSLLQKSTSTTDKPRVLIFHCEFSSERGPKMLRFLRAQDRELNKDNYPRLNFPEIYLLDGGYKAFYYSEHVTSEMCQPMSYKPMLHEDHNEDLRHFRKKSKSWTAGESQKPRSRFSRRKTLGF